MLVMPQLYWLSIGLAGLLFLIAVTQKLRRAEFTGARWASWPLLTWAILATVHHFVFATPWHYTTVDMTRARLLEASMGTAIAWLLTSALVLASFLVHKRKPSGATFWVLFVTAVLIASDAVLLFKTAEVFSKRMR